MKIALLSYEYPPDTGFGGIGTYTWYQARALVRLGHEVRVIAGSTEPGVFHSEHDGVQVTRVLDEGDLRGAVLGLHHDQLGWAATRIRTAVGPYLVLRDLLEHESFDIIEYPECGADGMLVSTMLPGRKAVRFHSPARLIMPTYDTTGRDREVTGFLEQIAINQAHVRLASSRFLADEVVAKMDVPAPVHVVPNGIDLDLFDQEEGTDVVERFGLPAKDAVTVLFSARLERRKGVHLLEDIFGDVLTEHPHAHFVVAGADVDDVLAKKIVPALEAKGVADRLHRLGRLPLHDVRALLRYVDIHLLPTLWDNAPYACIEAMAAGRAIVTSDFGGMPELIVHRQNGLLASTDDARSFAATIGELVEDRALRERLGAAARGTVEERFTDVAVAQHSVDVWRQAITDDP